MKVIGKCALAFASGLLFSCREKEIVIIPEKQSRIAKSESTIPHDLVPEFSGEKALSHVQALTDFGPRPPQSDNYRKSIAYLEKFLGDLGWKTTRQTFRSATPVGPVDFVNLLARYSPGATIDWNDSVPFIIGSHLDTKRTISFTFLGANDSGSSTGVLAEMARVLSKKPDSAKQVELVFFDGEEAMLEKIDPRRDGLYGSRYYAAELTTRNRKPHLGIVLDLVGDPNVPLLIGIDSAKALQQHALVAAKTLGLDEQTMRLAKAPIIDDHFPLIHRANLPTLHVIGDFKEMPYWHLSGDTMENLTAGALENCGELTLQILHQLTK